jgi:hypothetical protein
MLAHPMFAGDGGRCVGVVAKLAIPGPALLARFRWRKPARRQAVGNAP